MCGIVGLVRRPGVSADAALVRAMADAIRRRGPDADGVWTHDNVGLGHRRLSIIDTSEAANQPMTSVDGAVVIVFNGEIYNFEALRSELEAQGRRFVTRSDTEVLVHGWQAWGVGLLARLRGMFAFAVFDRAQRKLVLARDRLGKKPLHYAVTADGLVFGSELKAVRVALADPGAVDPAALVQYATYGNSLGERTIFAGVRKLLPAHYAVIDTDAPTAPVAPVRYWDVDFTPELGVDEHEWLDRLDATLSESVRLRMISDVALGAFLSGGIDSSLVAAYMTRHASQVKTFTIGFRERSHDESEHATAVARALGTDHQTDFVAPDALAVLPELVDAYDEPFADSSAIPTYYLCRAARQHVTVALSGDGGDELHIGYNRYSKAPVLAAGGRAATVLGRALAGRLAPHVPAGVKGKIALELFAHQDFALYDRAMGATLDQLALLRPEVRAAAGDAPSAAMAAAYASTPARPRVLAMQATDVHNYLPDDILTKVDRASMWHSLEVRCPLLDHEFVELSARIPPALKHRGLRGKLLLRRLLHRHVPAALVERPKMGFGVPVGGWLKRELAGSLDDMLADRESPMWTWFAHDVAVAYVDAHRRRGRDLEGALWRLLFFHAWARRHLAC